MLLRFPTPFPACPPTEPSHLQQQHRINGSEVPIRQAEVLGSLSILCPAGQVLLQLNAGGWPVKVLLYGVHEQSTQ